MDTLLFYASDGDVRHRVLIEGETDVAECGSQKARPLSSGGPYECY
jgi:hypothetical protein